MGRLIAMLGERYRARLERGLTENGYTPLFLPDNPVLDARLAGHADLSVFFTGRELIISRHLAENDRLVNNLTILGINYHVMQNAQSGVYPRDAGLCACRIGKLILHKRSISDPQITALEGFRWIQVRQGYAACAACVLDAHTILTADQGMIKAVGENGITCLELQPGGILLEGFSEGFVGGSMFRCGDCVYCTGTLAQHPDQDRILDFLQSRSLRFCPLSQEPAFDVGGVIVVPTSL